MEAVEDFYGKLLPSPHRRPYCQANFRFQERRLCHKEAREYLSLRQAQAICCQPTGLSAVFALALL